MRARRARVVSYLLCNVSPHLPLPRALGRARLEFTLGDVASRTAASMSLCRAPMLRRSSNGRRAYDRHVPEATAPANVAELHVDYRLPANRAQAALDRTASVVTAALLHIRGCRVTQPDGKTRGSAAIRAMWRSSTSDRR
jgi:hypothetical protein